MSNYLKIPNWIFYYTFFLGFLGIGAGLTSYIAPQLMFSNISVDFSEIATAVGMFAARNIAFGVMAFIALWSKEPKYMYLLFVGRVVTEIQDLLVIIFTNALPIPAFVIILAWLALFIIPEILALQSLSKKINH